MTIKFNTTGRERKRLAEAIANFLECDLQYMGAPTFAYQIDYFTVDREGSLSFDDRADSEVIENLLEWLWNEGFEGEAEAEPCSITVPKEMVNLDNLKKLVASKATLIKKALGTESLEIEESEDTITFPWFENKGGDYNKAYADFVGALIKMSTNAKRVTAKDKPVDNEKYAFRCFLLRLGFIGAEFKTSRKILLQNFTGSSSFKTPKEAE